MTDMASWTPTEHLRWVRVRDPLYLGPEANIPAWPGTAKLQQKWRDMQPVIDLIWDTPLGQGGSATMPEEWRDVPMDYTV